MSQRIHDGTTVSAVRNFEPHSDPVEPSARPARLLRRLDLSPFAQARLEDAAFRLSRAPESYDIACSDAQVLESPCAQGFARVYSDGRYWHIPGGLIVSDANRAAMVNWLAAESRRLQQTIAVYSVGAESVADFRDAGFAVNKFGEEPVLPLGAIDWRGHAFDWVRRQTHACRRRGLEVQEVRDEATRTALAAELVEIQTADLQHRIYSRPLRLLEGQFDAGSLQRRRLFVVRSGTGSGRIEAFLAASPMLAGQHWAFETYRKRTTAPRGTMPFLFRSVIDQLQAEGVAQVSLCLVPGRNVCSDGDATCDRRIRWLLELWYRRLHWLFNVAGQDFYKSRFRPEYAERFLCVYPQNTWLSFLSFLKVAGGLHPDLKNLARRAWPWRRKIR